MIQEYLVCYFGVLCIRIVRCIHRYICGDGGELMVPSITSRPQPDILDILFKITIPSLSCEELTATTRL